MRNSTTRFFAWLATLALLGLPVMASIVTSPARILGLFDIALYQPYYGELVVICMAVAAGGLMEGMEALVIRERRLDSGKRALILALIFLLFFISAYSAVWFGLSVSQRSQGVMAGREDIWSILLSILAAVSLVGWLKRVIWSARNDDGMYS